MGVGRKIEVWKTPTTPDVSDGDLEFAPFVRYRIFTGHHDTITTLEWSKDSRFILSASKDITTRIWSMEAEEGFRPTTLSAHKQAVVGAWFSADQETIYTVSKDGALFVWKYMLRFDAPEGADEDDEANLAWGIAERFYFHQNNAHVTCANFHPETKLLVTGFSHGVFFIHELPEFSEIQSLKYVWRIWQHLVFANMHLAYPKMTLTTLRLTRPANGSHLAHPNWDSCWFGSGSPSHISSSSKPTTT